jgi:hypothetical protein
VFEASSCLRHHETSGVGADPAPVTSTAAWLTCMPCGARALAAVLVPVTAGTPTQSLWTCTAGRGQLPKMRLGLNQQPFANPATCHSPDRIPVRDISGLRPMFEPSGSGRMIRSQKVDALHLGVEWGVSQRNVSRTTLSLRHGVPSVGFIESAATPTEVAEKMDFIKVAHRASRGEQSG